MTGAKLSRDLFVHGVSPAIGWSAGADRHPNSLAVIDEHGYRLSQRQAEELTRQVTQSLRQQGLTSGATAAVLGRNSAGFAVMIAAVSRTGADLVYLNPGFSPEQIRELCELRGVGLLLADPDLADRTPHDLDIPVLDLTDPRAWAEPCTTAFRVSPGGGRHIILTSGTTGHPKGADRSRTPLEATASLMSVLPYRERGVHVMAAPLFHSWGWLNHRLNALLDSTEVMVARPTAEAVLGAAERHRANLIVTTPVVVRRLADSGTLGRDLSRLQAVLVSGAPIPPDTIDRFQDRFGEVLFNLYGSTEVGYATVASPSDLAQAPTTAGHPLPGVSVAILDADGEPVADGTEGEVWVGSSASFDGYVDGQDKPRRGDLVSTGDLGLFDDRGMLFVHGRNDDLIISGGENVHPTEVEAVLRRHPEVADVAAIGRPDSDFGQRVVAYVVAGQRCTDLSGLPARVMTFARKNLAPYQRPRDVIIVSELPRNETGKVLRRLL